MRPSRQIALIVALAFATTILHYHTDPMAGAWHDVYQRISYIPIILAALWFGARGGLLTAFCIGVVYFPHLYHGWQGPHSTFYRLMEVGMYHVVGGLTGYLSSRVRLALEAETKARKEKENAYQRLQEKTEELFALEEQLRRSDRLAALGTLSAGLAHEIRNPLGSIKTSVEILRERHLSEASDKSDGSDRSDRSDRSDATAPPDLYAVLLEETDRMNRILTDFLSFARAEERDLAEEPSACRIDQALAKTLGLLEHQLAKKQVSIAYNPQSLEKWVELNESRLCQVFLNLILNSSDAMPAGGAIRIGGAEASANLVRFIFEDSGPGVPEEVASRVFDPFFTTKEGGTGLGLSIVERILASRGGRIALVRNSVPHARFEITLPAQRPSER